MRIGKVIEEALNFLDSKRMIRYDLKNDIIQSTELGRISSYFYVKSETMDHFCQSLNIFQDDLQNKDANNFTDYQILKIMARAKEFE